VGHSRGSGKVPPNCDLRLEQQETSWPAAYSFSFSRQRRVRGARMLSAEEPSMVRDLAATIALQGMPCDKVVDAKRNGDSDYTASCKDAIAIMCLSTRRPRRR